MASTNPTPAPGESGASGVAKKIGSSSVWVPGPALSLLLLLLLPPPLLSTGSSLHSLPVWRTFYQGTRHHRSKTGRLQTCEGAFDLYFILDTSDSVNDSWKDIYIFVDDVVKKFPNLKTRVSFITYSTQGHTLMKLTSDRNKIHNSLSRLKNIKPTGATNMHEGFKKANEQIEQENAGGNNAASLIIALTTGPLTPKAFQETKSEAEKARDMGAKVYCVGVKDYRKDQLNDIVERKDQMYGVDNGFKSLEDITNLLVVNSCHEVMAGESYFVCVGENYELMVTGTGFNNAKHKDEVICRFIFSENKFFDKKATSVEETTMMCPGVTIDSPDQVVFVEVSLNNGLSFISNGANITSKNCVSARNAPEAPQVPVPDIPIPPVLPPPPPSKTYMPDISPLCLALLLAALILIPLLMWCIWRYCFKRTVKEPPQVHIIQRGKLDTLCDFVQSCNQVPLMWCQPRKKGRCFNFTLVRPPYRPVPCSPKICLPPSQACFPINGCYSRCQHPAAVCSRLPSRMLPLISPPTRAVCGTTLSLPPP